MKDWNYILHSQGPYAHTARAHLSPAPQNYGDGDQGTAPLTLATPQSQRLNRDSLWDLEMGR